MGVVHPLDRFPLLRTHDLDEMRAALARIYADPRIEIVGRDRTLRAAINLYRLQNIEISFGCYAANFRMEFPETDFVSQIFPVRGEGEVRVSGTSFTIDGGRSVVISPKEAFNLAHNVAYERLVLRANVDALTLKLAALTGEAAARPLQFNPIQDWARPAARALREHFLFLVANVSASVTPLPSLVMAEFEQALLVMFLYANRNNYSDLLEREPPDAAPAQVRRVEEFIEANWDKPLSLQAVAEATGTSIGSLFRIFSRIRGYSPFEFLRRMRLRHAQEYLRHPDTGSGTTVADVAFASGYADFERFSDDYFQAFGERPGERLGPDPTRH